MKPYSTFSAAEFAGDDDFLKWVKYPDLYPDLDAFWRDWLLEHPHKKDAIDEARQMVLTVVRERQYFPDEVQQEMVWARIAESTDIAGENRRRWTAWLGWAAAVLVMLGTGWYLISDMRHVDSEIAVESGTKVVREVNEGDVPKIVILSDGTSIVLQPKSVLTYPETFGDHSREVVLTGEGFFEVAHDANKPFLVKTGEIVTRVLGTSFVVRNFEGEKNVLVQVKTGKVSVFRVKKSQLSDDKNVEGVVLTPNQQVLYERDEMKMRKSLVENPKVLIPLKKHEFEFVDTPIGQVFGAIEQAYGVDIVFDEDALSTCYLNASLTDVPLYEKLRLICKGINASYEIIDSHIIIYGRGCQENISNPKP